MIPEEVEAVVAGAAWSAACFCLGVTFAIYRAVGWVDRMRQWAHTSPTITEE